MSDLAWRYLEDGIPDLLQECQRCQAPQDVADPAARCESCLRDAPDKKERLEAYSRDFRSYMGIMLDLYLRQQAGWRIRNNDLSLDDWRVLGRIHEYFEDKRLERQLTKLKLPE